MYAYYKQAILGDIVSKRPEEEKEARKWDHWNAKKGNSKEDAKNRYIESFKNWFPEEWVKKIETEKKTWD